MIYFRDAKTVSELTNLTADFTWNYHEYEAKRITERKRKLVLPQRKISSREEFERLYPEVKEVFADGIERSIQRSKNKKNKTRPTQARKSSTPENLSW